jgi:hypothetical protein
MPGAQPRAVNGLGLLGAWHLVSGHLVSDSGPLGHWLVTDPASPSYARSGLV